MNLFPLLLFIPLVGLSQDNGIDFQHGLSWQQMLAKAKTEDKYIFVDCFTTWCGPCKEMDRDVYPNIEVGNYMNARFISIRIQMDTSVQDDEQIQSWRADAHTILEKYKVAAFPTFLFFSPDGTIVHRDLGSRDLKSFLSLAANASDPSKQYYVLLNNYQQGKKDYSQMTYLAEVARSLKEQNLSIAIAEDYINNYLSKLNESELYTVSNIDFIASFIHSSKEKEFNIFFSHTDKIDALMNYKGYCKNIIENIIIEEEINPRLWKNGKGIKEKPDWKSMIRLISKKYSNDYAHRTVLNAQLKWYEYKNDYPNLIKYNIKEIETYGMDSAGLGKVSINNMIYFVIFKHSHNKAEIYKGIKWMKIIVQSDPGPGFIDTYANLLYKAGRIHEALTWEKKATMLSPDDKEIKENYEKMKRREQTWEL